jgi:hypothetical protein
VSFILRTSFEGIERMVRGEERQGTEQHRENGSAYLLAATCGPLSLREIASHDMSRCKVLPSWLAGEVSVLIGRLHLYNVQT